MFKLTLLIFFTLCSCGAYSSTYAVWQTNIQVYVQSETSSSTAHMIQSENGIYNNGDHPWCGRRAYIDFADKALLSAASAAAMANRLLKNPKNAIIVQQFNLEQKNAR